jgi:hypothetical protein
MSRGFHSDESRPLHSRMVAWICLDVQTPLAMKNKLLFQGQCSGTKLSSLICQPISLGGAGDLGVNLSCT